ncbi:MAG: hypothetical protein ACTSSP_08480 [Candidatus Asgardarchaeia archaeon]
MAKTIKPHFEIIGFAITDSNSRKFVNRTCSVFFNKPSEAFSYKKKMRTKYKRKYSNKIIDGIKFGKEVEIDFVTKKR